MLGIDMDKQKQSHRERHALGKGADGLTLNGR